jgi:hypothetical protein
MATKNKKPKKPTDGAIAPGDALAAIKAVMARDGLNAYDVWKLTGATECERVSRTVVYEFVVHDPPRDASIATVERIAGALGIGLRYDVPKIERPPRANAAA